MQTLPRASRRPVAARSRVATALVIAVLSVALLGAWSPGPAVPARTPPVQSSGRSGVISGVVVDATTGAPIAGALVALALGYRAVPGTQSRQIADGQGRFVFVNLPNDIAGLTLTASRTGYVHDERDVDATSQPIAISNGQWIRDARVALRKLAAIGGTVVDERGEPVVGVIVRAYASLRIGGHTHLATAPLTMTDDRGQYRFGNLPAGQYVIAVPSVQASVPASTPATRIANFSDAQMAALDAAGRLAGPPAIVTDETTRLLVTGPYPVPPPSVGSRAMAYPMAFHPSATSIAEAGRITLNYGDARTDIDVTLTPADTATVRGRIDGAQGPLNGVSVRLMSAGTEELGMGSETATALVDADGAFRFTRVPLGRYVLTLSTMFGEYRIGKTDVGETARLRFPGSTGSGSNTRAVDGIPGASFTMNTAGPGLFVDRPSIVVDAAGIQDVTLRFREAITIAGTIRVEFPPGAAPPSPLPLLLIGLDPADGSAAASSPTTVGDANAPSHPFTFQGLVPGRYLLRSASSNNGQAAWRVKSVLSGGREYVDTPIDASGGSVSDVVVTLTSQAAAVTGLVLDTRGAPASGVTVAVFPVNREQWVDFGRSSPRMRAVVTGQTGRYQIGGLPSGEYHVVVVPASHRDDWRDPEFFETVAGSAARIAVDWGQTRDHTLRTEAR
jgi:hypothetical protein